RLPGGSGDAARGLRRRDRGRLRARSVGPAACPVPAGGGEATARPGPGAAAGARCRRAPGPARRSEEGERLTGPGEATAGTGLRRPERLLPLACLAAAIVLGASELMTTFQLSATGNVPLCVVNGTDRHHLAQLVLAVFGG